MHPWQAAVLGFVEGVTEFLPISSTGHLILAARALSLRGEAIKTFEVVIQAGALAAVIGLYWKHLASMGQALLGRDARGRQLLTALIISFLPAALAGLLLRKAIKAHLFSTWPVVWALAAGGLVMIFCGRYFPKRAQSKSLGAITSVEALLVGCAQCLALWPGMSRSMVTMLGGLALGWPATVAAEYSFLLALPTLGAATLLDLAKDSRGLVQEVGWVSIATGYLVSGVVAALAIKGFVRYLARHGLAPFGWYRLVLAALIAVIGWLR